MSVSVTNLLFDICREIDKESVREYDTSVILSLQWMSRQVGFLSHAYGSLRREVLYNIHTEFSVPVKLGRLIKICLDVISKVHTGKHLFGAVLFIMA
jgi:hypothetical protein